ncbi:hypothetical protein KR200_006172 [Drosophila serrata]|nr:hypothetical protein KR200_006172 [Drosophila serrata]
MHWHVYLLLGFCGFQLGGAASVYDSTGRLNLSASCPDTFCHVNDQLVAYSSTPALKLRELHLTNCSRQTVPWLVLNLTPGLRTLVVRNCASYHIRKESLRPVANLTSLQMQRTSLGVLRDELFTTVPRLEILELGHNTIHTVHSAAFTGLAKLRFLGLQSNGIQEIPAKTFDPLPNLWHLDLSGNQLTNLREDIFAKNAQLQTLMLNGNHLTTLLPGTVGSLPNLRLLDLGHAGELDNLMMTLSSIQSLILEDSKLSGLVISGSVIRLHAANNELNHIQLGNKSLVVEMDLRGNLLDGSAIAVLLRGMWNLERLDLSKNMIESLPMHGNGPNDGPYSQELFLLPRLKYLNLAHNRVVRLPPDSPILSSHLKILDLSHNLMLTLEVESLTGLPDLESLFLEGNRLSSFDYQVFHQQHESLKELGLGMHDNSWRPGLYHKMYTYLNDRGVHLQGNTPQASSGQVEVDWPPTEGQAEAQKLDRVGVSGIHPYWTLRDILAFVTLLVVLAILLMNLYNILEEEGCLRRLRRWRRSNVPGGATTGTRTSARRLNEQDSEV